MKRIGFIAFSLYYFFYFALVGVYIIFMPKALSDMGYSPAQVGIIYAAAPFMRFVLPFAFVKHISLNKSVYVLSLLLSLLATVIFFQSVANFYAHLLANLFFGAAMGISLPYVEAIALGRISKEHYGKVRLWGSIGFMGVALWLGSYLQSPQETFGYLSALALFTLMAGVLVLRYEENEPPQTHQQSSFSLGKYRYFWISVFLMQVGFGGFYNFFTIYETEHGVSLEMTSWLWSFGVLCEIVMLYFQGPLLRKNLLLILQLATLATALRWMIVFLFPDSLTMLFVAQSLHALSFALYHSAAISYVFNLYEQKKLAQQFFLGIAFGLGGSVGAVFAGLIYGPYLFAIESIITLMASVALMLHHKSLRKGTHGAA